MPGTSGRWPSRPSAGHDRPRLLSTFINRQINRIKRMFAWAAENELVPIETYQALASVAGLRRGRTEAREKPPVRPVPDELVEWVLPHLSPTVATMVRVQRPWPACGRRRSS